MSSLRLAVKQLTASRSQADAKTLLTLTLGH